MRVPRGSASGASDRPHPADPVLPPSSVLWHSLKADEVADLLRSSPERGLTRQEAARRRGLVGQNQVVETRERSVWRLALDQFRSLVVLLLLAASGLAALLGERAEAAAIAAALLLNAAIGFGTEWRARISLARLRALTVPRATVRRDGLVTNVPAADLVPGDVVVLEPGAQVPADARLVTSAEVAVNEASLTGESAQVEKMAQAQLEASTPLAERINMVYLGTGVLAGTGAAIVTATGLATELGRIGQLVALAGVRTTPLELQVEELGRRLLFVGLGICALVAGVGILHGEPIALMLETAISLAVAAIPEGLPAVTAVALAAGLWRLARAGALVRRLPAVETLGSTTVICTDKTGTMTENRMAVVALELPERRITVGGGATSATGVFVEDGRTLDPARDEGLVQLLRVAVLVNNATVEKRGADLIPQGDPTETALLVAAVKAGLDPAELARRWPRRREIPFSSASRFMATFNETPDGHRIVLVKGAPGTVLERSTLTAADRERLLETNRALGREGHRVLAIAWRPEGPPADGGLGTLTFLGFVALEDPVRPGVKDAIARCEEAGIRTVMLTGDQRTTAEAVGRELGLRPEAIRSRVTAEDKLTLIKDLQAQGEVVAMTGDGVNDAPALVRADIGIAMGRHGTDVAREAADLVLVDDNFPTIVRAVEEGRVIHANLRKVIHFLFSCNLSEIITIFAVILFGFPTPLLPLQILWVNLVTDILPAMALIRDPAEPDVMRRPPRHPGQALVTWRFGARMLGEAALLAAGVLSAYFWVVGHDGVGPRATTMAFLALVLIHPLQAMQCRSLWAAWWQLPANALSWIALLALALAQWTATSWAPLAQLLDVVPLSPLDWLVAAAAALWPVVALEAIKARRWGGAAPPP
jgi:P-type Ca2+ transporter type 2C